MSKIYDLQAWIITHDYNFIPVDPLKSERVYPTDHIASFFFANTSNDMKILVQYNTQELEYPE